MDPQPVIAIENLGKCYHIGKAQTRPDSFRAWARSQLRSPGAALRGWLTRRAEEEMWALRQVSFSVLPGEVVGVIGHNGAGKSTLLKILSRITDPEEGRILIRGRVNSLLEVGTGFHPELTGRENIYMNAAIHGLRRAEIARRFDEIVEFSEIGAFLDTPVKRYSSGMYTRLAFGVAAHLDPDILLVDEVLAVGDMAFQRKCLGQMTRVAREGRTVLFVSHNMAAVSTLCQRLILLDHGRVKADGPTAEVMPLYVATAATPEGRIEWPDPAVAPGDADIRLRAVRVLSEGAVAGDVPIDRELVVEMEYDNFREGARIMTAVYLTTQMGVGVFSALNAPSACLEPDPWFDRPRPRGRYRARCRIAANFLNEGGYRVTPLILTDNSNLRVMVEDAVGFTVHETGAMRQEYHGPWLGTVRPRFAWDTQRVDAW